MIGDIPVRGTLVHQGGGIRDTAGPMPIKAGTRVLPYDPEDDRQPPPPPGTSAASKKTRLPVSNLTI